MNTCNYFKLQGLNFCFNQFLIVPIQRHTINLVSVGFLKRFPHKMPLMVSKIVEILDTQTSRLVFVASLSNKHKKYVVTFFLDKKLHIIKRCKIRSEVSLQALVVLNRMKLDILSVGPELFP